jgi:Asp-tRNA(Asn)/Glu-tRNA(Gln) amidotransferase A subunit family amidase
MARDLPDLSIAEQSGLIAARKLSPAEVVEALIERVEEYDLGSSLPPRQDRAASGETSSSTL